jgi:amino acid transporter
MLRSLLISAVFGFLLFGIFSIAIPGTLEQTVGQAGSPLIYILNVQFGHVMGSLFKAIAFVAILSCALANMAVATRLLFSLSRDRMLPGASLLAAVNPRTRTPIGSITVIAIFALVINLLSAGIITRVVSIVSVCYYLTYLLTLISVLVGHRAGRIPDAPGYFTLSRSLMTLIAVSIAYVIAAIAALTLPGVNHTSAYYTAGGMAVGAIWWFAYLRPRIDAEEVGARAAEHRAATVTEAQPAPAALV